MYRSCYSALGLLGILRLPCTSDIPTMSEHRDYTWEKVLNSLREKTHRVRGEDCVGVTTNGKEGWVSLIVTPEAVGEG